MKTSLRFNQFYTLAGIVLCIGALVLTLFSLVLITIGSLSDEEGVAQLIVFLLSWGLAMMFGLRAHRSWALTLNLIVLALASVGLFAAFFFSRHPILLVGAVAAVACYTYYFRRKNQFPERASAVVSKALKNYIPTSKEKQARRMWRIGARIYLVVYGLIAVFLVISGVGLVMKLGWYFTGGLFVIGFGAGVFCWRLWVMRCAYDHWGTRMSLWETLTTGCSLAYLVSGWGPTALIGFFHGIWWVLALWILVISFQLFYFVASYRLRQVNLRFRDRREEMALEGEPAPA